MTNLALIIAGTLIGQVSFGAMLLAQAIAPDWTVMIGQFGIAGVLAFILIKLEPRLKAIEEGQIFLGKAQLLLVVSLRQTDDVHREQAKIELRAIQKKYPSAPPDEA